LEIATLSTLRAACKAKTKTVIKERKAVQKQTRAYLERLKAVRRAARAHCRAARRAAIRLRQ